MKYFRIAEKREFLVGYSIVFIGLIGIILVFSFSTSKENIHEEKKDTSDSFIVSGVVLPEKIDFANEPVPLEDFDVKEGLERELLINAYWHSQTLMLIKRSARYFGTIEPILKKYGIPDDFKFLALAESGFTNTVSPAGAVGFWQFISATGKDYGLEINSEVDERYHLEKSTGAACKFFITSHNLYKSWTMTAASYNMGRRGLNRQIERQYTKNYYDILLNEETARYLYRIIALKLILNEPRKYGLDVAPDEYYKPVPYSEIKVNYPIKDLALFAYEKGTNYKMLRLLNPWLRDNFLTNKEAKTYTIKIPAAGFRKTKKELDKEEISKILVQSEHLAE
jgi:membrane-bound lytic murein transglycosylase D